MLISRGCKFEDSKPGAVLCQKRGAVVSQLVPELKEAVPPPPPPGSIHTVCPLDSMGFVKQTYYISAAH